MTQTVLDAIRMRRTLPYTWMKPDPIAEDHLQAILEAAHWAPNHKHTEPWRFTIFRGEGRKRLADTLAASYQDICGDKVNPKKLMKARERPLHVPLTIGISVQLSEPGVLPEYEEVLAVGCAAQNLMLAARAFDIGSSWSTPAYVEHSLIRSLLGLGPRNRCYGFLYLGYVADQWPKAHRKPMEAKIQWIED